MTALIARHNWKNGIVLQNKICGGKKPPSLPSNSKEGGSFRFFVWFINRSAV